MCDAYCSLQTHSSGNHVRALVVEATSSNSLNFHLHARVRSSGQLSLWLESCLLVCLHRHPMLLAAMLLATLPFIMPLPACLPPCRPPLLQS